jgi:hypothetical protein
MTYETLKTKHDRFIWNVVNSESFDEETKATAQLIYDERNLDMPDKQKLIANFGDYIQEARRMVNAGNSKDAIEFLEDQGVSYNNAFEIVDRVAIAENNDSNSSSGIWYILITIFILFRLAVRLLN